MNRDRRIQSLAVFAARVERANRGSRSFAQLRRETERNDLDAHQKATRQPKKGEPGYVHGHVSTPDFRVLAAVRWSKITPPAGGAAHLRAIDEAYEWHVKRRAFRARNRLAEFGVSSLAPQPKRPHDPRQWTPPKERRA